MGADIGVGDVDGRDGANPYSATTGMVGKFIRKLEDLPKVGSRYLIADIIIGSMCLVGVSVAGYFLDQTHVMHL